MRALSVLVVTTLALALLPVLLIRAVWGRMNTGRWLEEELVVGRNGISIRQKSFAGLALGRRLPRLWHVLTGEYAWVGPRPVGKDDLSDLAIRDLVRLEARPGLVSLGTVRQAMGIAHDGIETLERATALEWRRRDSPALLVKALLTSLVSRRRTRQGAGFSLFGVEIDDRTMSETVTELIEAAEAKRNLRAAFVNPDCLNKAFQDDNYLTALHSADRVYADGIGLRIAASWHGHSLSDNVNGTDLFPRLCQEASRRGLSLYLLGARPGIAAAAAKAMRRANPSLQIAGTHHGYFRGEQSEDVCRQVSASGADLVLVAMGAPRQEIWLQRHHRSLGAPVVLGVGGLFDFYSGRIPRAPQAWRDLGLEWLFRLWREPSRLWKRYLIGNPLFLYRTVFAGRRDLMA
ncbi:MAG: WecB/TagA/CpsF family glycosyltransferase [Thermoanaerobaculia bacterium]|nr:WecB/TagA/CpsF family glycosyltransferase [Thermoanaerobaculia bacterium]